MTRTYVVQWHMDGTFEIQAESKEQVEEFIKTLNRQELVFKCRNFDYDIEEIDRSESGGTR